MPQLPETRNTLLLRIRDPGDEQAWAEFLDIYEPLIYRLARRQGLQDADARELTQEVLLAVAGAIERWQPDPARGSFRGWLFRIARNLMVNFLIRQNRQPRGTGDTQFRRWLEEQPGPPNAVDPSSEEASWFDLEYRRQVFLRAAERVKGQVQPPTWDAFWKTSVEGRTAAAVAQELGMSRGAVYVARSRVMARLRDTVEQFTVE